MTPPKKTPLPCIHDNTQSALGSPRYQIAKSPNHVCSKILTAKQRFPNNCETDRQHLSARISSDFVIFVPVICLFLLPPRTSLEAAIKKQPPNLLFVSIVACQNVSALGIKGMTPNSSSKRTAGSCSFPRFLRQDYMAINKQK